MRRYVVKAEVITDRYRTKEIEYTGRRHVDYNASYRELERALNDDDIVKAWIELEDR